ncbi:MAG: PAS domain-containing protein, partial [Stellaceae bacterium]
VILAEVLPGTPPRFRIRLHGTTLVQYAGYDLTGKTLDDMPSPEFRELARQSFSKVATEGKPLHIADERIIDERMRRYETILMPLSSDGERVDMLLIGMIYADERR